MTARPRHGWWRRNWWGLLAVGPMMALALGPSVVEDYDTYYRTHPNNPWMADPGESVQYAGIDIHLAGLVPTTAVTNYRGAPFPLPSGVQVWKATLRFTGRDPTTLDGCQITVLDRLGRTYEAGPDELVGADIPIASCVPVEAPTDAGRSTPASPDRSYRTYQTEAYFVLPRTATATELRLSVARQLPVYVRLIAA